MRKGLIKDHDSIKKKRAGQRKNVIKDVNVR